MLPDSLVFPLHLHFQFHPFEVRSGSTECRPTIKVPSRRDREALLSTDFSDFTNLRSCPDSC